MMKSILKICWAIVAVFAATTVAMSLIIALEVFSAVVHPVPDDFDGSMEQMCQHVAQYPSWVLLVVVPAWGFTSLVSTSVAWRIGGFAAAVLIGIVLVAAVVFNVTMLPYPLWFKFASVFANTVAVAQVCRPPWRRAFDVLSTRVSR